MKNGQKFLILGLCLLTLTSCSSSGKAYDNSYFPGEAAPEASYGSAIDKSELELSQDTNVDVSARKLIRDVQLNVETKGFDTLIADLNARVTAMDGYIEASEIFGSAYEAERSERYATLTYRIPAVKLDEFLSHVGENCNIVQRSEQSKDVTLTYVDLESRIKALESERDALLALLEKADSTSSILSIRSQLNDVIYQYESATAQLRALSEQVDYSTVEMRISEVIEYTEPAKTEQSMWEEISTGFVRSCKDIGAGIAAIFTFLAVNLPYLLILAVVFIGVPIGVYLFLTRKTRAAKREAKKQNLP